MPLLVVSNPTVTLPPDTFRCAGDPPITLSVQALPGATITWTYNGNLLASGTPSIQASNPGQYVVTVSYPGGCQATDEFNLSVLPAIPVNLGPDLALCAGDPPPVLDAGFPGNQYLWTLNGVPIATSQTLAATQSGTYAVVVSNPYGCTGRDTVVVAYTAFSVDLGPDQQLCAPSVVLDAGPNATTCQWTLNGTPLATTACQITATASGTYAVTAQNSAGCSASDQVTLTLGAPLTAQFSGPTSVQVGQPALFIDQTTPTPTSWTWNFGDGTPAVTGTATPTHTYTQAGLYPVVLAVSNGLCSDTAVSLVEALWDCTTLALQASFTTTPNPVELSTGGGTVLFNNTSTGATHYLWLFGTGDTSTAISPSYAYSQPGTYTVTLIAHNYNCRDTATQTVVVQRSEPASPSALHSIGGGLIRLYPNPTQEAFYLELPPQPGPWYLRLYEATGKKVLEEIFSTGGLQTVFVRHLSAGYYLVELEGPTGQRYRGRLAKE